MSFKPKKSIGYLPDIEQKKVNLAFRLNMGFIMIVILSICIVSLMSFRMISNSILSNSKFSSAQLVNQTAKNIEVVLTDLDNLALSASTDSTLSNLVMEINTLQDVHKKADKIRKIREALSKYAVNRNDITDIAVLTNSDEYIASETQGADMSEYISYSYAVRQIKKSNKKSLWLDTYYTDIPITFNASGDYHQVFSIVKAIYSPTSPNRQGALIVNVKEPYLYNLISDIKPSDDGKIYIVNNNGNYVMNPYNRKLNGPIEHVDYDSYMFDYNSYLKYLINQEKGNIIRKVLGKDHLISFETIEEITGTEPGWKIVVVTPVTSITAGITDAGKRLFFLGLICVAFGFTLSILIIRIYNTFVDRKYTEKHSIMMEQERLSSLGQLIGGIAHNFKTPIMSIAGGLEALNDLITEYNSSIEDTNVTDEDHRQIATEMKEWVQKIRPYCSYMSEIISTVKGQAVNCNESTNESFSIDELIKRVTILMSHELKRFRCKMGIDLRVDGNTEVRGEINNLVQILNNLISNSVESYNGEGGKVNLLIDKKGNNVEIVVSDYGCGIPEKVKNRLLKEMITTKGQNGTGLGLYMSYSTIKGKFGGEMSIESEIGKGTAISIIIPLHNK